MFRYDEFATTAPIRVAFHLCSVHWLHVINVIVYKVVKHAAVNNGQIFRPNLLLECEGDLNAISIHSLLEVNTWVLKRWKLIGWILFSNLLISVIYGLNRDDQNHIEIIIISLYVSFLNLSFIGPGSLLSATRGLVGHSGSPVSIRYVRWRDGPGTWVTSHGVIKIH